MNAKYEHLGKEVLLNGEHFADAATRTIDAMLDNLTDAEFDVLSKALRRFRK